jgi:16S rRNA processing protein RimM
VASQLIPIGEIVATHGLDGWLKLNSFNPDTRACENAGEFFLTRDGDRWTQELEASRPHNRQLLLKFRGIDSIEAAATLIGATLCVVEESLPALNPGEYYHYQAIGLEVFDLAGKRLGVVARTWSAGGGEIYIVAGESKEYLIPAVKDIIAKIDFDAGRMIIDPPEGLLDL